MRHNNQLPDNLQRIQNLIKRDPESYKDEFQLQDRHFLNSLGIFALNPNEENKKIDDYMRYYDMLNYFAIALNETQERVRIYNKCRTRGELRFDQSTKNVSLANAFCNNAGAHCCHQKPIHCIFWLRD
ncbi:hypothetical protein GQX74_010992 [Glossina fuscipes]|nr:hypothetical protein GQX74_010992 [Glossina fuscipes]